MSQYYPITSNKISYACIMAYEQYDMRVLQREIIYTKRMEAIYKKLHESLFSRRKLNHSSK